MKSKFFGLSAKLALAVLAVGMTLTSCYDSENGDVSVPSKPAAPTYAVNGVVTDFKTGEPIEGATVLVAGETKTTNVNGAYSYQGASPVQGDITISAAGYRSVVRTIDMPTVETGAVVFTVNAALVGEYDLPGIEPTVLETMTTNDINAEDLFDATELASVIENLVNNTEKPITLPLTVNGLRIGGKFVTSGAATKATDEAEEAARLAFIAYCKNVLGVDLTEGYVEDGSWLFNIEINPWTEVTALSFKGYAAKEAYTFPYEGVEYTYTIERVLGYSCEPTFHTFGHGHYQGHGHGHGGELNAGGGIWE